MSLYLHPQLRTTEQKIRELEGQLSTRPADGVSSEELTKLKDENESQKQRFASDLQKEQEKIAKLEKEIESLGAKLREEQQKAEKEKAAFDEKQKQMEEEKKKMEDEREKTEQRKKSLEGLQAINVEVPVPRILDAIAKLDGNEELESQVPFHPLSRLLAPVLTFSCSTFSCSSRRSKSWRRS